jgi:hypothetical protein
MAQGRCVCNFNLLRSPHRATRPTNHFNPHTQFNRVPSSHWLPRLASPEISQMQIDTRIASIRNSSASRPATSTYQDSLNSLRESYLGIDSVFLREMLSTIAVLSARDHPPNSTHPPFSFGAPLSLKGTNPPAPKDRDLRQARGVRWILNFKICWDSRIYPNDALRTRLSTSPRATSNQPCSL